MRNSRFLLLTYLIICLILLVSCSGVGGNGETTPTATSTPTPTSVLGWNRTLNVPYTEQPDGYTCGPTSLKMVMEFFGTSQTVTDIGNYMASWGDTPWDNGVGEDAIVAAAQHYGFSATKLSGWTNLKNTLALGKPCIAHIQIKGGQYPRYYPGDTAAYSDNYGHYIVVIGLHAVDDSGATIDYVVCNDPARDGVVDIGTSDHFVKYTYSSFVSTWGDNSYHLIVLSQ